MREPVTSNSRVYHPGPTPNVYRPFERCMRVAISLASTMPSTCVPCDWSRASSARPSELTPMAPPMIRNDNPTASQIPPNQSQKLSVVITRLSLVAPRALFFADRREQI